MTRTASKTAYWLYLLTVGLTAACGLIVEIVAGRMLAPYLGMSLYTWTAVIAVVLAGFSVGNWIGGMIADRSDADGERSVAWVLMLAAFSTAGSLALLRVLSGPVLNLGMAPVATIIMLTACLFFLPSVFVGVPSPILTKLAIQARSEQTGRVVGAMYAVGAFGSIIGTLAAGYVFISWLGSVLTMLMVAGVYGLLSLIYFVRAAKSGAGQVAVPLVVLAIGAGAIGLGGNAVLAFRTNCTVESDYYCLRVLDISADVGTDARVMVLDHLGHGMNIREAPQSFLSSYVELTDRLVAAHLSGRGAFSAYFVGGGAYTLPRAWSARFPEASITVAEIDPEVTRLADRELWLDRAKLTSVRHGDARRILQTDTEARYDVIVGDAFQDIAVPHHLVTQEFFALAKSRLGENGIYVMTAVDHVSSPRLVLSLVQTLKKAFPLAEVWLDDEQAETGGRSTFILLAGSQETKETVLRSQADPNRVWRRWSADRLASLAKQVHPILLTDDFAPVDRLIAATDKQ